MVSPHSILHIPPEQPLSQSRPCGRSLHYQSESSHQVCLLKLEFQHPAAAYTRRCKSYVRVWWYGKEYLCCPSLPCWEGSQFLHPAFKQILDNCSSLYDPVNLPAGEGGPPGERTFSLPQFPPRGAGPFQILFFPLIQPGYIRIILITLIV